MSVSNITIVGNIGQDPETRYTPNGAMNVQFSVATNRRFTDSSGQQQERTNWFRVTAWGRQAETLDNLTQQGYLRKGRQVFVQGRFESREYQGNDGQTRTSLDVNATEVQLLGTRADAEADGQGGGSPSPSQQSDSGGDAIDIDDVPF